MYISHGKKRIYMYISESGYICIYHFQFHVIGKSKTGKMQRWMLLHISTPKKYSRVKKGYL